MNNLKNNIQFSINNPRLVYTDNDEIEGTVKVQFPKDTEIKSILIRFESKLHSEIKTMEVTSSLLGQQVQEKRYQENHLIFQQEEKLFPPKSLSDISNKSFNIPNGSYEYEFKFKFPENCTPMITKIKSALFWRSINKEFKSSCKLPPSLQVYDNINIYYQLKLIINKNTNLIKKVTKSYPITFKPSYQARNILRNPISVRKLLTIKKIPNFVSNKVDEKSLKPKIKLTRVVEYNRFKEVFSSSSSGGTGSSSGDGSGIREPEVIKMKPKEVQFYVEVRSSVGYETIDSPYNFRVFLIPALNPQEFRMLDGESSGLGVFHIKSIKISLISTDSLIVQNQLKKTLVIEKTIFDKFYDNIKVDLSECIELPPLDNSYCDHSEMPLPGLEEFLGEKLVSRDLVPTFDYSTITRRYTLHFHMAYNEKPSMFSYKTVHLSLPITIINPLHNNT